VNGPHLFTHLKRATFYKARDFFVPLSEDPTSQLLKIARVLVRFDHVARFRSRRAALFFLGAAFPFPGHDFSKTTCEEARV